MELYIPTLTCIHVSAIHPVCKRRVRRLGTGGHEVSWQLLALQDRGALEVFPV